MCDASLNAYKSIPLLPLKDTPKPYAALAKRMQLPQTASLALAGPLEVPETNGGRAWLQVFDDDYDFIKVIFMSCLIPPHLM